MSFDDVLLEQGTVPPGFGRGDARRRCGLCSMGGVGECLRYGARVRPSEVCQSFYAKENTMLTPGSSARIYRDGTPVSPQIPVPLGRMEVRSLPPGQYEAVDETGGRVLFEVAHNVEVVVVQAGSEDGPVAAADSTVELARPADPALPQPVYPPAQASAEIAETDPEWRVTLPADVPVEGAGAAGEQPHPVVAGTVAPADMTVEQLQDALRDRGEKVSGTKDELVERLEASDAA